jgi:hypothetical protein
MTVANPIHFLIFLIIFKLFCRKMAKRLELIGSGGFGEVHTILDSSVLN